MWLGLTSLHCNDVILGVKINKFLETHILIAFSPVGGSIDTLMTYLEFMGDVWIFGDYLTVVL